MDIDITLQEFRFGSCAIAEDKIQRLMGNLKLNNHIKLYNYDYLCTNQKIIHS